MAPIGPQVASRLAEGRPVRLRARWVFPVEAEPIEHGTVEIAAGRITAVISRPEATAIDLGNAAIIPGLVNAHTHLEFSDLPSPLGPAGSFADWIRSVVHDRRGRTVPPGACVARGLAESARSGTTLLGEIASEGWSPAVFTADGPRAVVFRELIGLTPDRRAEQLALAREHLASRGFSPAVTRGISPHAPYSVHADLYRDLVQLALEHAAPLAVHLAETQAELELLQRGTGPLVDLLREFGVWQPNVIPRGSRPLDYLRALADAPRGLVIHGNYLSAAEIDFLAEHHNLAVVYCPRTHAYFGHAEHPWLKLLDRSVNVALGTDSRASNPDLSLWQELLFLAERFPQVDRRQILALGTRRGAAALGLDAETGTLAPGKSADVALVSLPARPASDPYALLFDADCRVALALVAGRPADSDSPFAADQAGPSAGADDLQ